VAKPRPLSKNGDIPFQKSPKCFFHLKPKKAYLPYDLADLEQAVATIRDVLVKG